MANTLESVAKSLALDADSTVAPLVHLNGTSKRQLMENLEKVHQALNLAYDDLKQAAPNGRDYYIGPTTLIQADRQHRQRMLAIDAVVKSIEREMEMIDQHGN